MFRLHGFLWFSALVGLVPAACVYDPDERCGAHQNLIDNDLCVCDPGFVPGDGGCVPCGEKEEESSGACVCIDGYARSTEGASCEPIPMTLGVACDTNEACDEAYPLCHLPDRGEGYCTASCSTDDDCTGGYKCHLDGGDSYCRRPALGYGDQCESDDDCADGEATYCEVLRTNQCLVPCDAGQTDVCFEGEVCCNYVIFRPICVPASACADQGTVVE